MTLQVKDRVSSVEYCTAANSGERPITLGGGGGTLTDLVTGKREKPVERREEPWLRAWWALRRLHWMLLHPDSVHQPSPQTPSYQRREDYFRMFFVFFHSEWLLPKLYYTYSYAILRPFNLTPQSFCFPFVDRHLIYFGEGRRAVWRHSLIQQLLAVHSHPKKEATGTKKAN